MNDLVSVVMLNWNTPEMTHECVQSVSKSNYKNFVINVIDNGSTIDNFRKLQKLMDKSVLLHRIEKNCGYVGGINYALNIASKQKPYYFLIMNNDTILDSNAITALVGTSGRYDDRCVVTGKVFHFDDPQRLQTVGNTYNRVSLKGKRIGYDEIDEGQYNNECERDMIDDIFMLLPFHIYNEVGAYNTFFYLNCEQVDLVLRIQQAGYKAIYTPDALLYHKGSFSSGGLGNPYMMYWDSKSTIILHFLYKNKWKFLSFALSSFVRSFYHFLKGLLSFLIGRTGKRQLQSRYARFRGTISGIYWSLNPKPETGFNPFQLK